MTVHTVNDHRIDVPADMTVRTGGMFDAVMYKGVEVNAFDEGQHDADGLYTGPFAIVLPSGATFRCDTLDAVRRAVDEAEDEAFEDYLNAGDDDLGTERAIRNALSYDDEARDEMDRDDEAGRS